MIIRLTSSLCFTCSAHSSTWLWLICLFLLSPTQKNFDILTRHSDYCEVNIWCNRPINHLLSRIRRILTHLIQSITTCRLKQSPRSLNTWPLLRDVVPLLILPALIKARQGAYTRKCCEKPVAWIKKADTRNITHPQKSKLVAAFYESFIRKITAN